MEGNDRIGRQTVTPTTGARVADAQAQRRPATKFDQRLAERQSRDEGTQQQALAELRMLVRAIQSGVTDPWQLTDLIFYNRHPQLAGISLTGERQELLDEWNSISALLVHPTLNEVSDFLGTNLSDGEKRGAEEIKTAFVNAADAHADTGALSGGAVHKYDDVIMSAVQMCPGLSPSVLKSLLAQESNFNTSVINQYGYAGIAQFGREAAREVGLRVGVAGSETDERLNPLKAIPAAARLLNLKVERLGETAFSRYGQPDGIEFWKFALAAYNGGEGTVALAMGHAYRGALAAASAHGLSGPEAVSFARRYASKWENLKLGGINSPLALATARYFPRLAAQKYHEIGNYPTAIIARAAGA